MPNAKGAVFDREPSEYQGQYNEENELPTGLDRGELPTGHENHEMPTRPWYEI